MIWMLCSALVMLSGWFVLAPLFGKSSDAFDSELISETEPDRLLDKKATLQSAMRDLESEYKMGRLSNADFAQLEAEFKNDQAIILQQLERLGVTQELDELIENEIAARKARPGKAVTKCPACGAQSAPGKKFCADCGHQF
jgi:hypothetical protein